MVSLNERKNYRKMKAMDYTKNVENAEFRVLSLLGMLCVISGHFGSLTLSFGNTIPYESFYMPLFVFISGYFLRTDKLDNWRNLLGFIKKKICKLLIPYFIINFFYGLLALFLENYGFFMQGALNEITFETLFQRPMTVGDGFVYNTAGWFVITLFYVECIYAIVFFVSSRIGLRKFMPFIYLLIAWYTVVLSNNAVTGLEIDEIVVYRVTYLMFWFEIGHLYKSKLEEYDLRIPFWIAVAICLAVGAVMIAIYGNYPAVIFVTYFYGQNPFYVLIRAGIGIWIWIRMAKALTPILKDCRPIMYASRNTYSMMLHQGICGMIINGFLGHIPPFKDSFNWKVYRSQIWYSVGTHEVGILYVILIPIMICGVKYVLEKGVEKIQKVIANRSNTNRL